MKTVSRREVLSTLGGGFGGLVVASMLEADSPSPPTPLPRGEGRIGHDLRAKQPHFPAKAKAVIQLFMHGGPSHLDLLDPKPVLDRYDGQAPPAEVADDERLTGNLLKSPFRFRRHGQSGLEFSEVLPNIARHADKIAVIRSMFTEH